MHSEIYSVKGHNTNTRQEGEGGVGSDETRKDTNATKINYIICNWMVGLAVQKKKHTK